MPPNNEYARQALLALKIFLASRRDGANVPQGDRESAAKAVVVLEPFIDRAESEISGIYGDRPFPAQFFIDLLNGFVNKEWDRRMVAGADMGPVVDTIYTLNLFLNMADKLLPELAARSEDDGKAN